MDTMRSYLPSSGRILIALPLAVLALFLGAKSPAHAQEDARELVEKMVAAYGGEHLLGLKTLRLKQEDAIAFPGQGYTPKRVEYGISRSDAILDFVRKRGSVESWSAHSVYDQHSMTLVDGERQFEINHQTGALSEEEPNFDVLVLRQVAAASWGVPFERPSEIFSNVEVGLRWTRLPHTVRTPPSRREIRLLG